MINQEDNCRIRIDYLVLFLLCFPKNPLSSPCSTCFVFIKITFLLRLAIDRQHTFLNSITTLFSIFVTNLYVPSRTIRRIWTDLDLSATPKDQVPRLPKKKDLHKDCTFSLSRGKILFEGRHAQTWEEALAIKIRPKASRLKGRVGHR